MGRGALNNWTGMFSYTNTHGMMSKTEEDDVISLSPATQYWCMLGKPPQHTTHTLTASLVLSPTLYWPKNRNTSRREKNAELNVTWHNAIWNEVWECVAEMSEYALVGRNATEMEFATLDKWLVLIMSFLYQRQADRGGTVPFLLLCPCHWCSEGTGHWGTILIV